MNDAPKLILCLKKSLGISMLKSKFAQLAQLRPKVDFWLTCLAHYNTTMDESLRHSSDRRTNGRSEPGAEIH
jgi:hypothetical protein